jgi:hypothetical protein
MAYSQVPWGVDALGGSITEAAIYVSQPAAVAELIEQAASGAQ